MNQGEMLADLIEQTDVDIVMCAGRLTLLEQDRAERMLRLAAERGCRRGRGRRLQLRPAEP